MKSQEIILIISLIIIIALSLFRMRLLRYYYLKREGSDKSLLDILLKNPYSEFHFSLENIFTIWINEKESNYQLKRISTAFNVISLLYITLVSICFILVFFV
jgi:hypothetical protein